MKVFNKNRFGALVCGAIVALCPPMSLAAEGVSGADVVSHCEYKNAGTDNTSKLAIILVDKDGKERRNVYRRLWKRGDSNSDVLDKMVLYTEFPPDAKGNGFMRWGYTAESGKPADQWLYLPQSAKVRRVSVRDPGDSFLGSDLTYGDIDDRAVTADEHSLVKIDKIQGNEFYVVESVPKESNALYSKRVSWYFKSPDWEGCYRVRTQYYDRQGALLKNAQLSWQNKAGAWAWDKVLVENMQNGHKSLFVVTDVKFDVGLKDRLFTERALKKGL